MPEATLKILCVDDEPNLLAALSRQLRRKYEVFTANGGNAGIELFKQQGPFPIIISDMRMPEMNGATFLGKIREIYSDSVRILLTGQTDLQSAIAAVNEGYIFRFLTKPCENEVLFKALEAASEQYRLITSEKILLEKTLQGSVQTLLDLLSLTSPQLFSVGRSLQHLLSLLLTELQVKEKWPIEVAAKLSQMAVLTLPDDTFQKFLKNKNFDLNEEEMIQKLPEVNSQLLSHIPRLEPVREILLYQEKHYDGSGNPNHLLKGKEIPLGARIIKILLDYQRLQAKSYADDYIFDTLHGRKGYYDEEILEIFSKLCGKTERTVEIREVSVEGLIEGMTLTEDLCNLNGVNLIRKGVELTPVLLERILNISKQSGIREPIRVSKR